MNSFRSGQSWSLTPDPPAIVVIHTKNEHCHAADKRANEKHILSDSVKDDSTQKPTDARVLYG